MAKLLKLRRGTTTQHSTFTGAEGECTVDLDKDVIVVHDGSTQAGHPLAAEDLSNVSSATIVGRLNAASIPTVNIANGALPTGVTVTTNNITNLTVATEDIADGAVTGAKIANSTITNDDVNASAAIARTKLANVDVVDDTSPQLGGGLDTNGNNITFGDSSGLSDDRLVFGAGSDLQIYHTGGTGSYIKDGGTGNLELWSNTLVFRNAAGNEVMAAFLEDGTSKLYYNNVQTFETTSTGATLTGNLAVTGTVDGVDIAVRDTLFGSVVTSSGALGNGVVATTQSASDNSAKVATTAYVETAISNLVDSAPGTLNTLNELAAALGDDASFSTTVTNSIATKMPLSGGAFTGNVSIAGNITWGDSNSAIFGAGNDLNIYHNGTDSIIDNNTNNLEIVTQNSMLFKIADAESAIICNKHGAVDLYHDNSKKFETTSYGGKITGQLYADGGRFGKDDGDYLEFTTDTRADLVINGNNEFRFESDGDFHADGDVIAFSTTIASDKNLKENIEVIPNALEKVEALRGVTFDWKRDLTPSAGVIAQEVEAVLPEAVKEVTNLKDGGSHLSVNYHALTSILIESIKELSARVKELEAK